MCVSKACALPVMPQCPSKCHLHGARIPALRPPTRSCFLGESWRQLVGFHQLPGALSTWPPVKWTFHLCAPSLPVLRLVISPGKVQRSFHIPFPVAQNHLMRTDGHPSSTSESLRETGWLATFRFLVLLSFSFVFLVSVAQWELNHCPCKWLWLP